MREKWNVKVGFVFIVAFIVNISILTSVEAKGIETLETNSDSKLYVSDAAFFDAKSKSAVVFVPGFIFNKESWYFLAKKLKKSGISSISLNSKSVVSINEAINFLKKKDITNISLVGGSSGAASVLQVAKKNKHKEIKKIVLMSPVRGDSINNEKIDKLFIVSKKEKSYQKVHGFYKNSIEPKKINVYDGNAHAQFLFKSKHKDEITNNIINFILKD